MTGALERILADKRRRIERGEYSAPAGKSGPAGGKRFVSSLREPGTRVIAEFKHRSPSAGEIVPGADGKVETFALAYRRGHAAAISVVTEEDHFGGKPDWLARAKKISGLPVLMKDFILSEGQLDFAVSLGADAILLIVRALAPADLAALSRAARERGLATLVEAHGAEEIGAAASVSPDVLGVNSRNLSDFSTDLAAMEALASRIPAGPVRLAESGIGGGGDIRRLKSAGYEAFLVGEALLRAENPERALRDLQA